MMSGHPAFWQCDDGRRFYILRERDTAGALSRAVAHSASIGGAHEVTLWARERANMYVGPPVWKRPRYLGRVLLDDPGRNFRTEGAGKEMTMRHPDDVAAVWTA